MMGDLFGKPQSWYDNLNSIQNQLAVLISGISSVGQSLWDTINDQVQTSGAPVQFDSYRTTMDRLSSDMTGLMITSSHTPSDQEIQSAQIALQWWNPELAYARSVTPEIDSSVQADMEQTAQSVSKAPLRSPASVGTQAFEEDVAKRATALGQGILDWTKYVAWAAGAIFGIYALSKFSGGARHAA
jgi:hypothetical protein